MIDAAMNSTTDPIVTTNYGLVQGVLMLSLLNDVYYAFHGMPYARPPLGAARFKVSGCHS